MSVKKMRRKLWNLACQVQSLRLRVGSLVYLAEKMRMRIDQMEGDKQ